MISKSAARLPSNATRGRAASAPADGRHDGSAGGPNRPFEFGAAATRRSDEADVSPGTSTAAEVNRFKCASDTTVMEQSR